MKKSIFLLLVLSSSLLVSHEDLSANESMKVSEMRSQLIDTNVNYLKNDLFKKIRKAESKLEKYKMNLVNSQSEADEQIWSKQIDKLEKKIHQLKEILSGIGFAESSISN